MILAVAVAVVVALARGRTVVRKKARPARGDVEQSVFDERCEQSGEEVESGGVVLRLGRHAGGGEGKGRGGRIVPPELGGGLEAGLSLASTVWKLRVPGCLRDVDGGCFWGRP